MRLPVGLFTCLLSISVAVQSLGESGEPTPPVAPLPDFTLPFTGPGQLVMIMSPQLNRPQDRRLVVATRDSMRVLPFERPSKVHWRSPSEMIVEQSWPGWSGKILGVDRTGKVIEAIADGYFTSATPAPDGRRVAIIRAIFDDLYKGLEVLDVRDLAEGFPLLRSFPHDDVPVVGDPPVWSPDGKQVAISYWADVQRIAVASVETGEVRHLYDSPEDRKRDPYGLVPIFWYGNGIYARSARGLLRCDPQGAGCTVAYDPGKGRRVLNGTLVGSDQALLLVQDIKAFPIEARAKEIHRLDLSTGKGKLWVRLPTDLFVWDIDWIGESRQGERSK